MRITYYKKNKNSKLKRISARTAKNYLKKQGSSVNTKYYKKIILKFLRSKYYNEFILEVLKSKESFRYQFLDRLKRDCDYYLGNGNRHSKHLWSYSVEKQIAYMKVIWRSFSKNYKPKWLTWNEILRYEKKMTTVK